MANGDITVDLHTILDYIQGKIDELQELDLTGDDADRRDAAVNALGDLLGDVERRLPPVCGSYAMTFG